MNIRVAARVRPFSNRQKERNSDLCVDMMGSITRLVNPQDPDQISDFLFDNSFWSHENQFVTSKQIFADQQQVYQFMGKPMFESVWEGYNCCFLAYGQTGSGKTYTLYGRQGQEGIIPRFNSDLFHRLHQLDSKQFFNVNMSMIQIYNQKLTDLLVNHNCKEKAELKIREDKTKGIYIQGLKKHKVNSFSETEEVISLTHKNQNILSTMMGRCNSRAQTILTIQLQRKLSQNLHCFSTIHFVDLAGSQRIGKVGVNRDIQREVSTIGKSLTVLGVVISALAEKSMGNNIVKHIPYRDSHLTRILQNALGGKCETSLICLISPASQNFDESMSTLRFGSRACRIKNFPVINVMQIECKNKEKDRNQIEEGLKFRSKKQEIESSK